MKLLTIIAALLIATSCSVEKRLYNRGFHIEWKGRGRTEKPQINSIAQIYDPAESLVIADALPEPANVKAADDSDTVRLPETANAHESTVTKPAEMRSRSVETAYMLSDSKPDPTDEPERLAEDMKRHRKLSVTLALIMIALAIASVALLATWDLPLVIIGAVGLYALIGVAVVTGIVLILTRPDIRYRRRLRRSQPTGAAGTEKVERRWTAAILFAVLGGILAAGVLLLDHLWTADAP
jgi:hypothetical protein